MEIKRNVVFTRVSGASTCNTHPIVLKENLRKILRFVLFSYQD